MRFAVLASFDDILASEPLVQGLLEESRFNAVTYSIDKFKKIAERVSGDLSRQSMGFVAALQV